VPGKERANRTHYEVGRKVRQTIKELGGTMPEDLPTPATSVKAIEACHETGAKVGGSGRRLLQRPEEGR
jgi:DNA-damage-inducible protein D